MIFLLRCAISAPLALAIFYGWHLRGPWQALAAGIAAAGVASVMIRGGGHG